MLCCLFMTVSLLFSFFFFFNDTATTEIYTLSLHDALPICRCCVRFIGYWLTRLSRGIVLSIACGCRSKSRKRSKERCHGSARSEEHTSELQSHLNLVCRLLLEKKKKTKCFYRSV